MRQAGRVVSDSPSVNTMRLLCCSEPADSCRNASLMAGSKFAVLPVSLVSMSSSFAAWREGEGREGGREGGGGEGRGEGGGEREGGREGRGGGRGEMYVILSPGSLLPLKMNI